MSKSPSPNSPFDAVESAFAVLHLPPALLSLNGTSIPGLANRRFGIDEVAEMLLGAEWDFETKDHVVNAVLAHAKAEKGNWTVALTAIVLPGLRRAAKSLCRDLPQMRTDLESEMLTGLLAAISQVSLPLERPASVLVWKSRNYAARWLNTEATAAACDTEFDETQEAWLSDANFGSRRPPLPCGHPDLVLAKAVAKGVILAQDAELIGVTRFERVDLFDAARALGITHEAAKRRRLRAEEKIVAWIRGELVTPRPSDPGLCGKGRPRRGHAGIAELARCQLKSSQMPEEVNTPTQIPRGSCRSTSTTQI